MDEEIRFVEVQFQRVSLGPTDVIILSWPRRMSDREHEWVQHAVERAFGKRRVLILEDGAQIGAMGPPQ